MSKARSNCYWSKWENISHFSPLVWGCAMKASVWPNMTHDILMTRIPFKEGMPPSAVLVFRSFGRLRDNAKHSSSLTKKSIIINAKEDNFEINFEITRKFEHINNIFQSLWQTALLSKWSKWTVSASDFLKIFLFLRKILDYLMKAEMNTSETQLYNQLWPC